MAVTRAELRARIANRLGDLTRLVATADGSPALMFDERNLTRAAGAFEGSQIVFVSGTPANIGHIATISGSSETDHAVSFFPSAPATVLTGDTAHLLNDHGLLVSVSAYDDLINTAITELIGDVIIPATLTISTVFDQTYPYLAIPTDAPTMRYAYAISYVDADGVTQHPPAAGGRLADEGWTINGDLRLLQVYGSLVPILDQATITVYGFSDPVELNADSEITTLNAAYLEPRVAYMIIQAVQRKGRSELGQLLPGFASEFNKAQRGVRPGSWPINTVRLSG